MKKEVKDQILDSTDFKQGALCMRYLGVALTPHKSLKDDTLVLVDKISIKFQLCARKRLTYASMVQLTNSVLITI